LLLVEVAEKLAASVEGTAQARALVLKAGGMLPWMKPLQAQQVLARLLVAGKRLSVPDAALVGWWDRLADKEARAEVTVRLLARQAEVNGSFEMHLLQREVAKLGKGQPVPGFQDAAADLLEQAEKLLPIKDEVHQRQVQNLLQAAIDVLKASHTVHAELLVRWSARFFQAGREDLARQLFEQAEKNLGAPHEELARLYYYVARLWNLRGRGEVIRPRLELVEKELSGLEQVYQPFALAWLASAWEEAGDAAHAQKLMEGAINAASTNENPRMRFAGAAVICLNRAATGHPLSADIAELAAELLGTQVRGNGSAAETKGKN
jgi:tetratricopeptide (TPR) repeat protein